MSDSQVAERLFKTRRTAAEPAFQGTGPTDAITVILRQVMRHCRLLRTRVPRFIMCSGRAWIRQLSEAPQDAHPTTKPLANYATV